jgi:hypothetical protein
MTFHPQLAQRKHELPQVERASQVNGLPDQLDDSSSRLADQVQHAPAHQ